MDSQKSSVDAAEGYFTVEAASYDGVTPVMENLIAWFDANDMRKGDRKMDQDETLMKGSTVYAPLTGLAVALEEVQDPVFAGKVLGDRIGIIPSEGKIVAPVEDIENDLPF